MTARRRPDSLARSRARLFDELRAVDPEHHQELVEIATAIVEIHRDPVGWRRPAHWSPPTPTGDLN